ncbi:MAG TPA: ABC transporter permease subunit [Polyangiales bacterium]
MTAAVVTPISPRSAFLRLELADALRSRWVVFTAAVYTLVFGAFVWLGLRESSVLGFTGLSRVVLNMANAVAIVLPLVSLVATSQAVVRARSNGFFELFLAQPARRGNWFSAMLLSRLLVIAGPLIALLLVVLGVGLARGEAHLLPLVCKSALVTLALTWAFVGIGFWLSALARTPERATVYALVAWLAASALHDFALIGVLLKVRLAPQVVFALAAANPVESARLAILSGVDPELSVLGPVGFWLANTLGSQLMFSIGVVWPLVLGALCIAAAARRLHRMDLVS